MRPKSFLQFVVLFLLSLGATVSMAQSSPEVIKRESGSWVECEGVYGGHLQGVATDGVSLYWSHTVQLVKTDLQGNRLLQCDVPRHHGDLTVHNGRVIVAVELAEFNRPPGASDPWVYVYDAASLKLLSKHRIPELVHGAGGIAYHDGSFIVVGGLPGNYEENYAFEYDETFRFIKRHVLFSGQTHLGIQTVGYMDGHWWFGCYGSPGNPGLLKADEQFRLVGQSDTNFSYGIARLDANTIIRGDCFENNRRGKVELLRYKLPDVDPVPTRVRLAAYNVLFGIWAEPEAIGEMFKPYHLDVIGFSEVPDGEWTERVGRVLGMGYTYVGQISSANHQDKFKSILSRTPLANPHEIEITAEGWSPASLVGAKTFVRGIPIDVYSTHIPGRPSPQGSAAEFIAHSVIPESTRNGENMVVLGDLNNLPGDVTLKPMLAAGMRSMWEDLGINTSALSTHQHIESGSESGVIDHILYSSDSNVKVTQGGVIYNAFNRPQADKEMSRYKTDWIHYGKPLSDHRPIWAELEFPVQSESGR